MRQVNKLLVSVALFAWVCPVRTLGQAPTDDVGDPNLVRNGEFDLNLDVDGKPDEWRVLGNENVDQELARDVGRIGGHAARLTCTRFTPRGDNTRAMLYQVGRMAVRHRTSYRLTFWIRQRDLETGVVSVALLDTEGLSECGLDTAFAIPTDDEDWHRFEFSFRATRDCADTSRLQFWFQGTGSLWFDDVRLEALTVPLPPARPTRLLPLTSANLVPNSSFECGLAGWGTLSLRRVPWGAGVEGLMGQVDHSTSPRGRTSFRISLDRDSLPRYRFDYFDNVDIPITAPLLGTVGWIPLTRGEDYVLSAYLKSDTPGLPVRLGACHFPRRMETQIVYVDTGWQRYRVPLEYRSDFCFPVVGPDLSEEGPERAVLWVDAIQLERGEEPSAYHPQAWIELGLTTDRPGNIFRAGEPAEYTVHVWNGLPTTRRVDVGIDVQNFVDQVVQNRSIAYDLDSGEYQTRKLKIPEDQKGFLRVRAEVADTDQEGRAKQIRAAIVPGYDRRDSVFGINHAYGSPGHVRLCREAGLTWFRDWSLKWGDIEPRKGRWDFSETDIQIGRILDADCNVLALLPFPSTDWSSSAPPGLGVDPPWRTTRRRIAHAPSNPEAFAEYIRYTVYHYEGRIRDWQIFNEPLTTDYSLPRSYGYDSRDYADWGSRAAEAIKLVDPDSRVFVGFASLSEALPEFKAVAELGLLDHCDGVTVHCYPHLVPPEHYGKYLVEIRGFLSASGREMPIWMTEHGYYADDDPEVDIFPTTQRATPLRDELQQAEYVIRSAVIQLAFGVQRIFFDSGRTTELNQDNLEGIFFEYGGAPRKVYAAIAACADFLSPAPKPGPRMESGDEAQIYSFTCGDRVVLVAWQARGPTRYVVRPRHGTTGIFDLMGNPMDVDAVTLASTPVYIVAQGAAPAALTQLISVEKAGP